MHDQRDNFVLRRSLDAPPERVWELDNLERLIAVSRIRRR